MKKTFTVDDKLFTEAKAACGAKMDTETVRLGLEALVRHAAYERLRGLLGSEPCAQDVPRRREKFWWTPPYGFGLLRLLPDGPLTWPSWIDSWAAMRLLATS